MRHRALCDPCTEFYIAAGRGWGEEVERLEVVDYEAVGEGDVGFEGEGAQDEDFEGVELWESGLVDLFGEMLVCVVRRFGQRGQF